MFIINFSFFFFFDLRPAIKVEHGTEPAEIPVSDVTAVATASGTAKSKSSSGQIRKVQFSNEHLIIMEDSVHVINGNGIKEEASEERPSFIVRSQRK